jgi:hypothetical protein
MKFCGEHWGRLRKAIEDRGLASLVPDSAEKAASNLVSELSGERTIGNYDPLMCAHNAILCNAMDALGDQALKLFTGDHCPLCVLNDLAKEDFEEKVKEGVKPGDPCPCPDNCGRTFPEAPANFDVWVDRAADDEVEEFKKLSEARGV